ncbi:MAG: amidohydrolase family protein, partial [Negativicutes bacterium]|nr:amidohydrolase family protein [Negativicutes bacterium]
MTQGDTGHASGCAGAGQLNNLIRAARKVIKADLVLRNGYFFSPFTGQFWQADLAIKDGRFAGWGDYEGEQEIDCYGKYIVPGFCDAHVHIESSLLSPREFAKSVLPFGTTTVIADPHEIANVYGLGGIRYVLNEIEKLDFNAYVVLPSCVPASSMSDSAARLEAA